MGAAGDGIARLAGETFFLPFTLPGETVFARPLARRAGGWAARAERILDPSGERAAPLCRHFGGCGGCALQHWDDEAYAAWKRGLLVGALQRAGYQHPAVAGLRRSPPRSRRRMDLAMRRIGAAVQVGLHERHGQAVVDVLECHVLHPALFALVAPLRLLLGGLGLLRREGSAMVNLLDTGPDLLLRSDVPPDVTDRTKLTAFARRHGLARIAWAPGPGRAAEPICVLRPCIVSLSGQVVGMPPGAFLQATAEGEAAITAAVLGAVPARSRVVELHAGCGTITHALAEVARVAAYEGDAEACAALRRSIGARPITVTQRDLAHRPLTAREFSGANAVVLDPPHAGAAAQMPALAASDVPVVVYVSCNPATLARDARMLREAGYQLISAVPIDQFLWSARLESVAVFAK